MIRYYLYYIPNDEIVSEHATIEEFENDVLDHLCECHAEAADFCVLQHIGNFEGEIKFKPNKKKED